MNLFCKIISGVLSVSICLAAFLSTAAADISVNASYVYDSIISDNCKDPIEDSDQPYNVFEIYDAYCNMENEADTPVDPVLSVPRNGIDVSQWQGNIDWQKMKDSGQVDFAIIKAGYGKIASQVDPKFRENMKNAQAAGMDVGVYWFSYAMSVEEARKEAYACLEVIKDYSFTYPVYYDFEYGDALNSLAVPILSQMVSEFCTILQDNGYTVGVYGSGSYLQTHIYSQVLEKYHVWVAEVDTPAVSYYKGDYGMWQHNWEGRVPGISGDVDLDICYYDYPAVIKCNPSDGSVPAASTPVSSTQEPAAATTPASEIEILDRGYLLEDTTTLYDWTSFDKSVYQFAMLAVQSGQDFASVKENIEAAHSNGINCGILYIAEDANDVSVKKNAEKLYGAIKDTKLEYPIYYWINRENLSKYSISASQHSKNIEAFCSYFESMKYYSGIAAYDDILNGKLSADVLKKYNAWLFNEKGTAKKYSGVCGIEGEWNDAVGDYVHYSYKNFPEIMKNNGLNGYKK